MQQTRIGRLEQQLRQEIATIIHQELKDPRLGFVTITRMELSNDLRHARVLFSCLGGEQERARSQDALDRSARFIYGLLKKRFRLKIIPELLFRYDASIEESIAMSEVLDQITQRPDARQGI
ncbi:MAG: 30S ribosome-binding factor RbfA [Candidatus Omnitrophica bacterium]|nr:30S ribosome-binding factor RbfA [Candidatus Omnitrophota bacterium]